MAVVHDHEFISHAHGAVGASGFTFRELHRLGTGPLHRGSPAGDFQLQPELQDGTSQVAQPWAGDASPPLPTGAGEQPLCCHLHVCGHRFLPPTPSFLEFPAIPALSALIRYMQYECGVWFVVCDVYGTWCVCVLCVCVVSGVCVKQAELGREWMESYKGKTLNSPQ